MKHENSKRLGTSLNGRHGWVVGMPGIVVGVLLLAYVPRLKLIASSILLFAGFHVVGAIVVVLSASAFLPAASMIRPIHRRANPEQFDFGAGASNWSNVLGAGALAAFAGGVAIEIVAGRWWPIAFLCLLAASSLFRSYVRSRVTRRNARRHAAVLPMVDLLRGDRGRILDAGADTGSTTVAIGTAFRESQVTAVDPFDTEYATGNASELLLHNLQRAEITHRSEIVTADLSNLPFEDDAFDAAVSTNVLNHLGSDGHRALYEIFRVLKPGARLLLTLAVPGTSFALGNVFSLFLPSATYWRNLSSRAGFALHSEGSINDLWFVLLEKPQPRQIAG